MAVHVHLKNEFTEDEKYHNLMRWLILWLSCIWQPAFLSHAKALTSVSMQWLMHINGPSENNLQFKVSFLLMYRNDLKFSDRYAWANSADPDQTVYTVAIPSALFGLITLW